MRIGQDFDKLQFDLFGLHLVEPNTFVGDTIIFFFAMYFAYQMNKFSGNYTFFTYWKWFFIVFGIGFSWAVSDICSIIIGAFPVNIFHGTAVSLLPA